MNKNEYWPGASKRVVSVIHRSMTGGENRFTRNKIGLPSALMTTRCRESAMTAPKQMIREKNRKSNNQLVAAVEVQQYLQCWQRSVVSGERVCAMQVVMEGDIQEVVEVA